MEKNLSQTNVNLIRVAIIGAESTGKTTLAQALAQRFDTHYVPEYMREYCQKLWDETKQICRWQDLMPIALGQMQAENQLAQTANTFLFCDTCLWELVVYAYLYFGDCPPELEKAAQHLHYDVVFLTDIDVPWVADDLRDKPQERDNILMLFQQFLQRHQIAFTLLSGSHDKRLQQAQAILREKSIELKFQHR